MPTQIKTMANTRKPVRKTPTEGVTGSVNAAAPESAKERAEKELLGILKREGEAPKEPEAGVGGLVPLKLQGGKVEQGVGEGVKGAVKAGEDVVKTAGSWTKAVGKFFEDIVQVHLWERIGKIVLGLIVLVFGIYFFARAIGGSAQSGVESGIKTGAKTGVKAGAAGAKGVGKGVLGAGRGAAKIAIKAG